MEGLRNYLKQINSWEYVMIASSAALLVAFGIVSSLYINQRGIEKKIKTDLLSYEHSAQELNNESEKTGVDDALEQKVIKER